MFFYRGKYNTNIFLNYLKFFGSQIGKKRPPRNEGACDGGGIRQTPQDYAQQSWLAACWAASGRADAGCTFEERKRLQQWWNHQCSQWTWHCMSLVSSYKLICGQMGYLSINISLFLVIWRFLFHFLYFAFFNSLFISPKQIHFSHQCNI